MPTSRINGFYNADRGLKRWRQSLGMAGKDSAGTGHGGVDIVCWGDSILEGYSGTDVTFDSGIHRLKIKLQERYNPSGVVGGYGFLPVRHGNGANSLWTVVGSVGNTIVTGTFTLKNLNRDAAAGSNGMYARLNGANAAWMRTAADAVQYIGQRHFSGLGSARWDTGVGSAPTIGAGTQTGTHVQNPGGTTYSGARFGTLTTPSFTSKIDLTSANDNYIQWAAPAATLGASYEGVMAYNGDFTCGVRLHDCAFYGSVLTTMLKYIRDSYNSSVGTFVTWGQGLLTGGACNAKLYIFNWITNDCGLTSTPTTSLSTFLSNYALAIDYALALASKPSVLLVIPQMRGEAALAARSTVGERFQDYVDGIYGLANARENVAILDLWQYFDRQAISASTGQSFDAGWYSGDLVHPSTKGQYAIGDLMYKILTDT